MNKTVFIDPGWSVRPVAGRIGAEISGVRLHGDLPERTVEGIRRALNQHKVLFFRGQNHLDDDEQEAFGRLLGEIVGHRTLPPPARRPANARWSSAVFCRSSWAYSRADSAYLIAILQSHVTRLENTVRWRWADGDVAIWDNRATQHYAIDDYRKEPRVMHRVTVAGDVPVGVGGRRGVARKRPMTVVSALVAGPELLQVPA